MTTTTQTLTAAEIMQTDVVAVMPATSLHEAGQNMLAHHIGGIPVVDVHRRCIGILTTTDIVNFLDSQCDSGPSRRHRYTNYFNETEQRWDYLLLEDNPPNELDEHAVSEAMSRPVTYVGPNASLKTVARKMRRDHCHRVLVLDEGHYPKGIISSFDFVKWAADDGVISVDH
jgi:CBS domain-containing protein